MRDEDLDLLKALRILAFRSWEKPDHDYIVRRVCRWYSRTFFTPLAEVESIPLETLLTHYFEVAVEEMPDEERDELRERLCETRAERLAREAKEAQEAADDAAFEALVKEGAKRKNARAGLPGPDDAPIVPAPVMGQTLPTTFTEDAPVRPLPPEIKMTFVPESELENLDEWDLLGPPKPDNK